MFVRIVMMIAAGLVLIILQPAGADDSGGQNKEVEHQKQKAEQFRRIREIEQEKIRVEQAAAMHLFRRGVVIDEPQDEFIDEVLGDVVPKEEQAPPSVSVIFEKSVFGSQEGSREGHSRRMEKMLHWKMESVDRCCLLTNSQRQKLLLAGRGDIKRLFDRIDEGRRQFADGAVDQPRRLQVNQMWSVVNNFQHLLVTGPWVDDNTLFARIMRGTLTAEQIATLAAMTEIERLHGRVATREQGRVNDVELSATGCTDASLTKIEGLPNLRRLTLEITPITDAGLAHLAGMKRLEALDLCGTRITGNGLIHLQSISGLQILLLRNTLIDDVGLTHLQGLASLRELHLQGTRITDAGLRHLAALQRLELLNLGRTHVTDAGLANLDLSARTTLRELGLAHTGITDSGLALAKGLVGLERLYLNGTQVTDAGLAALVGLRNLQQLYLDDTSITDTGLAHLKMFAQLRHLDLGGTRIGDAGLAYLKGLKSLEHVDLANTLVTDAGVDGLRTALPNLVVIR